MATQVDAKSGDLLLHHACLDGAGATREHLEASLASVRLPELSNDGWLYIPRHRSRAILRPDGRGFAGIVSAELRQAVVSALVDPPIGASAAAYRFTSRAAFAAWALGTWLAASGDGAATRALFATLPGGSPLAWLRREVLDDGRILPAVGAALVQQGQGARWLGRLDPTDRLRMRQALQHSHGLPAPLALVDSGADGDREGGESWRSKGEGKGAAPEAAVRAVAATARAARAAGNDLAALPAAGVELLLLLLQLQADPTTPRGALAAAAATIAAGPSRAWDAAASPDASQATDATVAPHATAARGTPLPSSAAAPTPSAPSTAASSGASRQRPTLSPASSSPPPPPAPVAPPATSAAGPGATPDATTNTTPTATTGFATDFAGLWFLCNAFLVLGLYGDFSDPGDGRLALAPSRLLDRLALRWFGARYRDDRLHTALTRDGRDPPLPRRWQVEPAWLEAFPAEEGIHRATSRHQQALWHPAGFPLRDGALSRGRGWRGSGRSMEGRRNPGRSTGRRTTQRWQRSRAMRPLPPIPSAQSARWLACLALYLDARIQRATGDPALGLSSLAIAGQCRIGAERVDVDLALADLPLPLRLAGLDRDPGWLPAEGRAIAFHFS